MKKVIDGFLVLEGLDGAGTTTQKERIEKELTRRGCSVMTTNEPTSGEIGRLIRRVLKGEIELSEISVAYLFAAFVEKIIGIGAFYGVFRAVFYRSRVLEYDLVIGTEFKLLELPVKTTAVAGMARRAFLQNQHQPLRYLLHLQTIYSLLPCPSPAIRL